uniref:Uncharacterized protein n=1 Tax=Rhizophagus irregularis (strain DAOM 181602 / DAOM 197198 / MUCL 43194) TaxID=747089 RepID=U9SNL9_RHIID
MLRKIGKNTWCPGCNHHDIETTKSLARIKNSECSNFRLYNGNILYNKGHIWTTNLNKIKVYHQWPTLESHKPDFSERQNIREDCNLIFLIIIMVLQSKLQGGQHENISNSFIETILIISKSMTK